MVTFQTRLGKDVTVINDIGLHQTVHFETIEQAELYELIVTGKVEPSSIDFCKSLIAKRHGQRTSKVMYWVSEMINKSRNGYVPATTVAAVNPLLTVDLSKVVKMFEDARQHLKRPKITLRLIKAQRNIRFTFDQSRTRLFMNGESMGYGYGYIRVSTGEVVLRQDGPALKDDIMELLAEFTAEPTEVAIRHGKLTGNCCFCSLPLSDPRSLNAGYGDTCAKHWHLPWGAKPDYTPVGDWALNPKGK
jgi:hypothetical protein